MQTVLNHCLYKSIPLSLHKSLHTEIRLLFYTPYEISRPSQRPLISLLLALRHSLHSLPSLPSSYQPLLPHWKKTPSTNSVHNHCWHLVHQVWTCMVRTCEVNDHESHVFRVNRLEQKLGVYDPNKLICQCVWSRHLHKHNWVLPSISQNSPLLPIQTDSSWWPDPSTLDHWHEHHCWRW